MLWEGYERFQEIISDMTKNSNWYSNLSSYLMQNQIFPLLYIKKDKLEV